MKFSKTKISAMSLVMILFTCLFSYVGAYDLSNESENTIVAEYTNAQNIASQYSLKISEAAQIPSMQTDDLVKIFNNALPARYGKDGSSAAMQWIKEQNPQLDQYDIIRSKHAIESYASGIDPGLTL